MSAPGWREPRREGATSPGEESARVINQSAFRAAVENFNRIANDLGTMPPAPPTLRARLSSTLVEAVRRALLWYTGQLRHVLDKLGNVFEEQIAVSERLARTIATNAEIAHEEVQNLRSMLEALRKELTRLIENHADGLRNDIRGDIGDTRNRGRRRHCVGRY